MEAKYNPKHTIKKLIDKLESAGGPVTLHVFTQHFESVSEQRQDVEVLDRRDPWEPVTGFAEEQSTDTGPVRHPTATFDNLRLSSTFRKHK